MLLQEVFKVINEVEIMPSTNDRWKKDPEYRKEAIRELEKKGAIRKLSEDEFGRFVYDDF